MEICSDVRIPPHRADRQLNMHYISLFMNSWNIAGGNLETSVISVAIKHVMFLLRHINNNDTVSILKTMENKEVNSDIVLTKGS